MKRALVALTCALVLVGCGSDNGGASDADQKTANDFCASEGEYDFGQGMSIDKYENPDGFDRCVKDTLKIIDCLLPPGATDQAFIPADCSNDGYKPL